MANDNLSIEITDKKSGSVEAVISGELIIDNSEDIKMNLKSSLIDPEEIILKIEHNSVIDLSFLQLLVATLVQRKSENKKSNITFNLDDMNMDLLKKTGFSEIFTSLANK